MILIIKKLYNINIDINKKILFNIDIDINKKILFNTNIDINKKNTIKYWYWY